MKRSIGHLCHDEPRDSVKGIKHDQVNTVSNSGAAIKQEDSLPYMLGPSIDQQQLDQHVLQDIDTNIGTDTVAPDIHSDNSRFQPQLSNPAASGQGQALGDKNSRCKRHTKHSVI